MVKINKVIERGPMYHIEAEIDGKLVKLVRPKALIRTKEDIVRLLTKSPEEKRVPALEGEV